MIVTCTHSNAICDWVFRGNRTYFSALQHLHFYLLSVDSERYDKNRPCLNPTNSTVPLTADGQGTDNLKIGCWLHCTPVAAHSSTITDLHVEYIPYVDTVCPLSDWQKLKPIRIYTISFQWQWRTMRSVMKGSVDSHDCIPFVTHGSARTGGEIFLNFFDWLTVHPSSSYTVWDNRGTRNDKWTHKCQIVMYAKGKQLRHTGLKYPYRPNGANGSSRCTHRK